MKLWKFPVAAVLLAPMAGCVSKTQLREANQALELENFHLEQRLNDICWKLQDAERDLDACRATGAGAIPIYNGGSLTPVAPAGKSSPSKRDPRRPADADDVDKPPKIELPDDEPNMPSAGKRKERAPRYSGPPVISPPDPNVPEGILPHSVSSRHAEGEPVGPPEASPYPHNDPPREAPRAAAEPEPVARPMESPNWRQPSAASPPPGPAPQPEAEYVRPQESPAPYQTPQYQTPESVGAPMPSQVPNQDPMYSPGSPPVSRYPEPVAAPTPTYAPAPAPVARGSQSPEPEPVAAPPGSFDTELRGQPDGRPLVEPEPVAAPYPSAAARPTAAAPAPASRPRGATQTGNAALSMMAMNPKLTIWRQSPNVNSPDDGLTVVVEPRTAAGEMVEVDGEFAIIALDPTLQGPQAKVARWDFPADKVANHFKGTQPGGGFHFPLEWPGPRPSSNRLDLYVRLTLPDQRQFVAEYSLEPTGAAPPIGNAQSPDPEPVGAPTVPPSDPPTTAPVEGGVSRTAAWTKVDERGGSRNQGKSTLVKRAGGPASDDGQWKRALTPLPAPALKMDQAPATDARSSQTDSKPAPTGGAAAWTPYR